MLHFATNQKSRRRLGMTLERGQFNVGLGKYDNLVFQER
jgi:hypothetical protein